MLGTHGAFDEDTFLLYPDDDPRKFGRFSQAPCETPIIKGVVAQLRKWPSDLLLAFLAACLIIGSLMLLVFVTVALCLPTIVDKRCRVAEGLEIPESPNVYFLKLENRTWSTREFCYIETAARSHPDLNVYLINLLSYEPHERRLKDPMESETSFERTAIQVDKNTSDTSKLTPEEHLRYLLIRNNANIRNIDVSIDRLFKGSKLSRIARSLNASKLEMAAKAQLLWNSAGIVLSPSMYCNLKSIERFICNGTVRDCLPDKLTTIEVENEIQATGVPCQAFMGFLMHDIFKNRMNEKYSLKDAVENYCPRLYYCPEIRILRLKSKCSSAELDCPIVYSSTMLQDNLNAEVNAT